MKTKILIACFCSILTCASAFGQCGGYPFALQGWYGVYPHSSYSCDYVPYYAMHPPVYYSYHTARTYGESPYPYPPGMASAQQAFSTPSPQIIKNEYADEDSSSQAEKTYPTGQPLRISNPFVEQSDTSAMVKGAKWGEKKVSKPLVVYPTANVQASN
jgi:hypothetical protein